MLQYQSAEAAGTGMVLTSNGEILTNNHVVDGATSIKVTVVTTGGSYTATVVGTDPTDDVAVLQLSDASGLQTAKLASSAARVGESVTGVGNAGGTGTLTAATGTVTALDQTITASDQNGGNAEQLSGLIETNAAIQSGDSGGPLYGSSGTVIGMDTAASSGGQAEGYAIPIATAEEIAKEIESGADNATIHQGYPAFLGVSVQDGTGGAAIAGVLSGGPAADAGIAAGDVVTAVGGTAVDLRRRAEHGARELLPRRPGDGHLGGHRRDDPLGHGHPRDRPRRLTGPLGPRAGEAEQPPPPHGCVRSCALASGAMIGRRAPVAQRIEQVPSKHLVAGSSPAGRAATP